MASPAYLERVGGIASPRELARATRDAHGAGAVEVWFEVAGLGWPEPGP